MRINRVRVLSTIVVVMIVGAAVLWIVHRHNRSRRAHDLIDTISACDSIVYYRMKDGSDRAEWHADDTSFKAAKREILESLASDSYGWDWGGKLIANLSFRDGGREIVRVEVFYEFCEIDGVCYDCNGDIFLELMSR